MICSKTKSTGVEIVYRQAQRLSCFDRHIGVLERVTNAIFPFVNGRCHLEQSLPFLKQSLYM